MSTGFQYRHARELLCHSRMDSNSIGQILKKENKFVMYVCMYVYIHTLTFVQFLNFAIECMYVCTNISHMHDMDVHRSNSEKRQTINPDLVRHSFPESHREPLNDLSLSIQHEVCIYVKLRLYELYVCMYVCMRIISRCTAFGAAM